MMGAPNPLGKLACSIVVHHIGADALQVAGDILVQYAGAQALDRLLSAFGELGYRDKIREAFKRADACFADKTREDLDRTLHEAILSLPLAHLDDLEGVAIDLPKSLDDVSLRKQLRQAFELAWPNRLKPEELDRAARLYLTCLDAPIATVGEQLLPTLYRKIDRLAAEVAAVQKATATIHEQLQELKTLWEGLSLLPTSYAGAVQNYFEEYLGTAADPEPFGGRAAELAALSEWLHNPGAPAYAVLEAPAGRGKSALLAHWVLSLTQSRDWAVVFFPISERFGTNSESAVFSSLLARIALLHGTPPARAESAEQYRSEFQDYLRRPLPDGRRLLVVLDGLDEAVGWEARAGLFPTRGPEHLKVLAAARELAGDLRWPERLGWRVARDTQVFGLGGLSFVGLQDVIRQMGDPLNALTDKPHLTESLYTLTEQGDPLLVRLYVEALRQDRDRVPELEPADLDQVDPGLNGFFTAWFRSQEAMWRRVTEAIDHDRVDALLNIRAIAHGPLTNDDICRLCPEEFRSPESVARTAFAVRRFLIGDGTQQHGYSFSHPRLRIYFRDRLSRVRQSEYQRRILEYGQMTLRSLYSGELDPKEASAYIIRNYRIHLEESRGSVDDLCALMSQGWLRAWQGLEGTEDGFLGDVRAGMRSAASSSPSYIGQLARGLLCHASVVSVGANVPTELLVAAVRAGVLNIQVARILALRKPKPLDRVNALVLISESQPWSIGQGILCQALQIAHTIQDERARVEALAAIVERLPAEASDLLADALSVTGV